MSGSVLDGDAGQCGGRGGGGGDRHRGVPVGVPAVTPRWCGMLIDHRPPTHGRGRYRAHDLVGRQERWFETLTAARAWLHELDARRDTTPFAPEPDDD